MEQRPKEHWGKFKTRRFCSEYCAHQETHKTIKSSNIARCTLTNKLSAYTHFCPICFVRRVEEGICKRCEKRLTEEFGDGVELVLNSFFLWRQTHYPQYFAMYCLVYPHMEKYADIVARFKPDKHGGYTA